MTRNECLEILEIPPNASREDIVTAYRQLVQVWHPDRFPNNAELQAKANAKLTQINDAYSELIDEKHSEAETFASHRDEQVKYLGNDPRLKTANSPVPAIVEVSHEGMTVVTFNRDQADEVACYPRDTLLAARVGDERWVRNGVDVTWTTPHVAETVDLQFVDPEGILTHPIVATLRFRNTYFAQLLVKRMQPSTGWAKWIPQQESPPTTSSRAQTKRTSTDTSTNPNLQSSPGDSLDTKKIEKDSGDEVSLMMNLGLMLAAAFFILLLIVGIVGIQTQSTKGESASQPSRGFATTEGSVIVPSRSSATLANVVTSFSPSVRSSPPPSPAATQDLVKISHQNFGKSIIGYVPRKHLAASDSGYSKGDTVEVRLDRKIRDHITGGTAGTIYAATIGVVRDLNSDDVLIRFELQPPLRSVVLRGWQIRRVGLPEKFLIGDKARINVEGTCPLLDGAGREIGQLNDGTIVYVSEQ